MGQQGQNGADQGPDAQAEIADWRHPVLLGLFISCLLPELLLSGADLRLWGQPFWRMLAVQNFGFWPGLLDNWRPNYRVQPATMFLTYCLLHAGFMHFAVNMMTLFSLGRPLLARFGGGAFMLLYLASAIGGSIGFALLSSQILPMVGASGALFGLAGALVGLHHRDRLATHDSQGPVVRAVLGLVALNLVLWWAMDGQLAWETHLGGFLTGWGVAIGLDRRAERRLPPPA